MTITTVDHVTKGVDRLPYKLKQDNVEKLLTLFLEKSQEIEDEFVSLANQKSIDLAEGTWLDYIGKIVGVVRGGLSDADYRTELKFKIGKNNADGTPNIIIDLVKQFTEAVSVRIAESGVAFATLSLDGQDNIGTELWGLIQEIRPTSTRFIIHSDFFDSAFLMGYENNLSAAEVFQTTDDGVIFENFEVTLDGINFEPLFTVTESQSYHDQSLVSGRNSFYYEDPFNFYVTSDGNSFEQFVLVSGRDYTSSAGEPLMLAGEPEAVAGTGEDIVDDFKVVMPYDDSYNPYGLLPLHWEVVEDSFTLDAGLETLYLNASLLDYYANYTLPADLN